MRLNWFERMRPVFENEGAGSGAAGSTDAGGSPAAASGGGSTVLTADEPAAPGPTTAADALYSQQADAGKPGEEAGKVDDQAAEWKEYIDDPNKTAEENAALKAEHDKTKPAEGDDKKKADEKPKLTAEEIDLTPPEGFSLDNEVAAEFKQFVIDGGFTKEQVETLKGMQVKLYEKQSAAAAEQIAKWGQELKTNKEFGGEAYAQNMGYARSVIRTFFPPEAKTVLDQTGLGNHPDIVAGFVRMGKAMSEGGTFTGKNGEGAPTIVDAMYGSS